MNVKALTLILITFPLLGSCQSSEEDAPEEPNISPDGRQSVVLGVVSVQPKGGVDSLATGRFPWPPRPPRCPQWNDWENVTCWWPSVTYNELPESCTFQPIPKHLPSYIKALVESKSKEMYDVIAAEYQRRGKPTRCGYCSRSFKCRTRNTTDDEDVSDFGNNYRRFGPSCAPKQVVPVESDCEDHAPCEVTKITGGCPPPLFLHAARIDRIRGHIENGDHEEAVNELFASRMGPGMSPENPEDSESTKRKKRHANFEGFESFDTPRDDAYNRFNQHDAPMFEGYGAEMPYERMGRYRDDGRSFVASDEDPKPDAFRPLRDDIPPPFEQFGPDFGSIPPRRRGSVPHGPRIGGPASSEFGHGSPRPHGRGPSSSERPRESSSSSSSESSEERPPFRHHGHHHFRPPHHGGFPPHHRHGFSFPPPFFCHRHPWLPFCRFVRRGVRPPAPPPCGPFGKCFPPFGGPMNPFDGGVLPIPPEATSGWVRPRLPVPPHRPFGPRPDRHHKHAFIVELLHGTTCASVNGTCLCCCGPYVPNIERVSCEDLRDLIPRIDDLADALQKALGNPEAQLDLDKGRTTAFDVPNVIPDGMSAFEKMKKPDQSF